MKEKLVVAIVGYEIKLMEGGKEGRSAQTEDEDISKKIPLQP